MVEENFDVKDRRNAAGEDDRLGGADFEVSEIKWFRTDYGNLRTLLADHLNSAEPFGNLPISLTYSRQLMHQHLERKRDHTHRLFALLVLSIWAQR